jgi:hypothetical protein
MTEPEMHWVESSNIEKIGYEAETQDLYVGFKSGPPIYIYEGVPQSTYDELMSSPSKGSYLSREIKPTYHFRTQ